MFAQPFDQTTGRLRPEFQGKGAAPSSAVKGRTQMTSGTGTGETFQSRWTKLTEAQPDRRLAARTAANGVKNER